MRLALFVVVFHIFQRGESRFCQNIVTLRARVVDWAVGVDGEDVGLAVLFGTDVRAISRLTFWRLGLVWRWIQ